MKVYTNESQTAKLIELGFARPRIAAAGLKWEDGVPTIYPQYTIGELLSFLPRVISDKKFDYATINIYHDTINWVVGYDDIDGVTRFITSDIELIDSLCTLCRKIKAAGMI